MWECLDTGVDYDWIDVLFIDINVWCDILIQNQSNNDSTLYKYTDWYWFNMIFIVFKQLSNFIFLIVVNSISHLKKKVFNTLLVNKLNADTVLF